MALAIDASSPAVATQTNPATTTVTTASFTPPAGSVLLIRWSWNTATAGSPSQPTITDNLGSPLTYTLLDWSRRADGPAADGQAAAWVAVATGQAMTITVTSGNGGSFNAGALLVTVLTGADTANPVGAHGKSGSTSAASIAQSYTAQATGGWGFIVDTDWDVLGAQSAGTGCTSQGSANVNTDITYGFMRRTSADDANGVSNTLNVTLPGTSTNLRWAYAEVLPAPDLVAGPYGGPAPGRISPTGRLTAPPVAEAPAAAQVEAADATASAGFAATSTAVKVAVASATCSVGFAATSTAVKVAPAGGVASAGFASTSTARKVAPGVGVASAGLAALSTAMKVAPAGGYGVAGPVAWHSGVAIRACTGTAHAGLVAYAAGAKVAPGTGLAAAGCSSTSSARKLAPGGGYCAAGAAGYSTARKVATPTGYAAAGLAGYAGAAKKAIATGCSCAGLHAVHGVGARACTGIAHIGASAYHHQCTVYRSTTGTTTRPTSGTQARPDTGLVEEPC